MSEIKMVIFQYFMTFYRQKDESVNQENNCQINQKQINPKFVKVIVKVSWSNFMIILEAAVVLLNFSCNTLCILHNSCIYNTL